MSNETASAPTEQSNSFLETTEENRQLNQYWYSKHSIETICNAIREGLELIKGKRVAFLSTPSLFFSLSGRRSIHGLYRFFNNILRPQHLDAPSMSAFPESEREHCALFDFDTTLSCKGYYFYDYQDPTKISNECLHSFDMVVIDPPFISHSVWEDYARTAKCLLKADKANGTLVLATTVEENGVLLKTLFGNSCNPALFRPCIPNLVYQYSIFSNWPSSVLSSKNNAL